MLHQLSLLITRKDYLLNQLLEKGLENEERFA